MLEMTYKRQAGKIKITAFHKEIQHNLVDTLTFHKNLLPPSRWVDQFIHPNDGGSGLLRSGITSTGVHCITFNNTPIIIVTTKIITNLRSLQTNK
jgi:hypothetical protein